MPSMTDFSLTHPQGEGSMAFLQQPENTDFYEPTNGTDDTGAIKFQAITHMNSYKQDSFEELRLNDYASNKRFGHHDGLAAAALPREHALWFRTPYFRLAVNRLPEAAAINYGSKILTLRVGKDPSQDFPMHENLLRAHSEFVRLALKNDWKESQERVIPLPEDSPETVNIYQQWVYSGCITTVRQDNNEYQLLVKAYIFGEKMMDGTFKDILIDCIVHKLCSTALFDTRLTSLVYENTPPQSPLRRLLQDIYVWSGYASWLDEGSVGEYLHAEFLIDLGKRHMELRAGGGPDPGAPFIADTCFYHEHELGECFSKVR